MELGGTIWLVSSGTEIRLWWTADWHIWNKNCAMDLLKRHLSEIAADRDAYLLHGGDYAEFISPTDPRFDASALSPAVMALDLAAMGAKQVEDVRELLVSEPAPPQRGLKRQIAATVEDLPDPVGSQNLPRHRGD